MRAASLSALLFTVAWSASAADVTPPAAGATTQAIHRYLFDRRNAQDDLLKPGASKADAQRAATELERLRTYLETPAVAERAISFDRLYSEHVELQIALAWSYMRQGRQDDALVALEKVGTYMWYPALGKILQQLPDLAPLRGEPRYTAMLQTWDTPNRVYGKAAFATPYQPDLTAAEKTAGLSLFWAEAREHFAWFDHVPELDWNKTYVEYLSKVAATRSTREYYDVMRQLAALLQDGHSNVYLPGELQDQVYQRPALDTALVEDKVLVTSVGNEELGRRIHVGDEVVAIDGEPVRRYAEQRVQPYVAASTPQDRTLRTYGYELLSGDLATPVKLRLRGADGAEREETVARGGRKSAPRFVFNVLPGGVAYIAIDDFESDKAVKAVEKALPEILQAKALIIDVRRNGGGNSGFGLQILSYLGKEGIPTPRSYERDSAAVQRARGNISIVLKPLSAVAEPVSIPRQQVFQGPVAVLTSARTFSAAEDFAASFRLMKRGIIVGEATGGSTGQALSFPLPGGGMARICVKRDTWPDGSTFVGKGIQPDIAAAPTIASIRAGSDPVLEAAVEALQQPIPAK
ncbi:S41 family peptidase [Oxalobacteraceae bacterium A2-2]